MTSGTIASSRAVRGRPSVDEAVARMGRPYWTLSDSRGADVAALYRKALREEPDDGSWSLDITDAVGEIDIRGYAPRRIRRNPRYQAVITMEQARSGLWRTVNLDSTLFQVTMKMMLRAGDWEGAVLAANPASRDFADQVAAIDELRSIGAIEPD